MGCRLPKLRKAEERKSPGNIYSTLRRPQVETKVGVAYTYHFLDFLLGKEEVPVSSVLCLSSVRELPVQVRELYSQGFVLVAVHPFVHPCGPRHAHIQRQLHRAVLVRETQSSEKISQLRWCRHRLETDVCVAGNQTADPEIIQSYVKRIQDVAEQGVMFVGFLQQPGGGPSYLGQWDPEELSSLHSSPSPIHRHALSSHTSPTEPAKPPHNDIEPGCVPFDHNSQEEQSSQIIFTNSQDLIKQQGLDSVHWSFNQTKCNPQETQKCPSPTEPSVINRQECLQEDPKHDLNESTDGHFEPVKRETGTHSWLSSPELDQNRSSHNNNHIRALKSSEKDKNPSSPPVSARSQLFALYNHTEEPDTSLRFYSLKVPLRVQKETGHITDIDAHWLDHMTQHFTSGAQLVDGFFHIGEGNDNGVSPVDSIFIFQSSAEETLNSSYDAIVVEQWTVIDGVVVKTDYVPLLQSLAPYGWRLMCVLPTPIVKTNSDGSLSTKQILFLQRPIMQRRRKDFKMLNLRSRNKAKKNCALGTFEENCSPVIEMDSLRRNMKDEEEEAEVKRKSWGSEQKVGHQKAVLFLSGNGASVEKRAEETDIDAAPVQRQEKSVRWTDVCQRDRAGLKEKEVKSEEPVKLQLFSGVC